MKAIFEYWQLNAPGVKDPRGPFEIFIREHRTPTNGKRFHGETSTGDRIGGTSAESEKLAANLIERKFARKLVDWSD